MGGGFLSFSLKSTPHFLRHNVAYNLYTYPTDIAINHYLSKHKCSAILCNRALLLVIIDRYYVALLDPAVFQILRLYGKSLALLQHFT